MGMITRNTQVLFERAEVNTYINSQLEMHKILRDVLIAGCYTNSCNCLFVCFGFLEGGEKFLHYCRPSKLDRSLSFLI